MCVVVRHGYAISGGEEPIAPLLHRVGLDLGQLGVVIFFSVSGFLVVRSWTLDPSWRDFVRKRVLRIWPGLIVMLLVVAFVMGPLVTNREVLAYMTSASTFGFVLHNVLMSPITVQLKDVFEPDGVNASLWTLPYEVLAYVTVLLAGLLGVFRRRMIVLVGFVGLALLFHFGVTHRMPFVDLRTLKGNQVNLREVVRLFTPFAVGAVMWLFRDRILLRLSVAIAACGGVVAALVFGWSLWAYVLIAYLAIYAGTRSSSPARRFHRFGDPSYGIYIYSFPIQQLLVLVPFIARSAVPLVISSAILATVAGYLSWHLVERPAMRLRPRKTSAQIS
jgi:peptidoglycan/LPS O-acetylase OafA/YrhL